MRILVKITKEIIRESATCGLVSTKSTIEQNCLIAVGVREIFPTADVVYEMDHDTLERLGAFIRIRLPDRSRIFIIPLPEIAFNAMLNFDSFSKIEARLSREPFGFEITVPMNLITEISISQVYKILSESRNLEMVHP